MSRRALQGFAVRLTLVLAVAVAGGTAGAQTLEDSVVAQLREQGYVEFSVERTLLGRIKIVALSGSTYREIVINPSTGEILRDYWRNRDGRDGGAVRIVDPDDDNRSAGDDHDDADHDDADPDQDDHNDDDHDDDDHQVDDDRDNHDDDPEHDDRDDDDRDDHEDDDRSGHGGDDEDDDDHAGSGGGHDDEDEDDDDHDDDDDDNDDHDN
jgi:hypothetical protein